MHIDLVSSSNAANMMGDPHSLPKWSYEKSETAHELRRQAAKHPKTPKLLSKALTPDLPPNPAAALQPVSHTDVQAEISGYSSKSKPTVAGEILRGEKLARAQKDKAKRLAMGYAETNTIIQEDNLNGKSHFHFFSTPPDKWSPNDVDNLLAVSAAAERSERSESGLQPTDTDIRRRASAILDALTQADFGRLYVELIRDRKQNKTDAEVISQSTQAMDDLEKNGSFTVARSDIDPKTGLLRVASGFGSNLATTIQMIVRETKQVLRIRTLNRVRVELKSSFIEGFRSGQAAMDAEVSNGLPGDSSTSSTKSHDDDGLDR